MKKIQWNKIYVLYFAELLILLLLLGRGAFRGEQDIITLSESAMQEEIVNDNGDFYWQAEPLYLKPGVYRIALGAELPANSNINVSIWSNDIKVYGELLANGVSMYSGQDKLITEFMVTSEVEACLKVTLNGDCSKIKMNYFSLRQTNRFYFVLACCYLMLISVVNALIYFRRKIQRGSISTEQQIVVWGVCLAVLIAVFPYLTNYITVDGVSNTYLNRIEAMKCLWYENGGLPLGEGDLFLWLPVAMRYLGFTLQTSYRWYVFTIIIATELTAYFSMKGCVKNKVIALVGSGMYLLSPYHIHVIYNQGDILEAVWMIFLPLIVCGMWRILVGNVIAILPIMLGCCLWVPAMLYLVAVDVNGLIKGGVSFVTALGICVMIQLMKREAAQNKCLLALSVMMVMIAIYQVNDIAYHKQSVYLYHLNPGATNVPFIHSSSAVVYAASLFGLLGIVLWGGYELYKRSKRGRNNG